MPVADLLGQKLGLLRIVAVAPRNKRKQECCQVVCECGTSKVLPLTRLTSGNTKSCGCLKAKMDADRVNTSQLTHGDATKANRAPEYVAWVNMNQRCYNPGNTSYDRYGAIGVRVCEDWRGSYEKFFSHIGRRPARGYSVDRIDPFGNYEPGNVRWATVREQTLNKRKNHR